VAHPLFFPFCAAFPFQIQFLMAFSPFWTSAADSDDPSFQSVCLAGRVLIMRAPELPCSKFTLFYVKAGSSRCIVRIWTFAVGLDPQWAAITPSPERCLSPRVFSLLPDFLGIPEPLFS